MAFHTSPSPPRGKASGARCHHQGDCGSECIVLEVNSQKLVNRKEVGPHRRRSSRPQEVPCPGGPLRGDLGPFCLSLSARCWHKSFCCPVFPVSILSFSRVRGHILWCRSTRREPEAAARAPGTRVPQHRWCLSSAVQPGQELAAPGHWASSGSSGSGREPASPDRPCPSWCRGSPTGSA